jgi:phospholipid/cholesterol/gamma-HCH transport system substrate-binding protein
VYIGLDAGGDTVMLKDGDRITKTQSAVVIEKLISQFLFEKASENTNAGGGAEQTPPKPPGKTAEGAKK